MTILVAPTEPLVLRELGRVDMLPERMGCDVLVFAGGKKIGVQRKEVRDLVASLDDGRLAMQLSQMTTSVLDARVVVVEGEMRYAGDGLDAGLMGQWNGRGGRVHTAAQMLSVEWAVRAAGVDWARTNSLEDTVRWIAHAEQWWKKEKHHGVSRRPAAPTSWGKARNYEWAAWVLQGFEGIGSELAKRIVAMYGLPLRWTITPEELAKVQGISLERARKWISALEDK